ncbi:hypothetical protein [Riemerella anatipestifer]|uniref:hypothetical protein n=1 Tax=Riemerella anatipestifer TaxID=34085 RepID=UPI001372C291|nr:hypothetical protein [Riemerella anatipestifer]MBT0549575.1 hypothetical protein [Riemerella anatipestifer]MBT0556485.1 hypothetical protein [Riemerella anatipestifer]MBT0560397.1 hypothetical protein [Riemerella anatipestifer]NAV16844.1 hypothetical protein [Riemerella anatipestifer]UZX27720.1 hypothetical protein OIS45_10210 [Riemerella anatipestifer]
MEKKSQNQKFQELVKKMEALKESEKGKLKGGFTVLSSATNTVEGQNPTNYFQCTCNNYGC